MAGKRTLLTRNEALEVMRFVADVAALRADPIAQRQAMIDGILDLGGADAGFAYFARDWRVGGAPRIVATAVAAGSTPVFSTYVSDVISAGGGVEADPYCLNTLALDGPLVSVSRSDVVPDIEAQRQFETFAEWGGLAGLGDGHVCFGRLDRLAESAFAPGDMVGVGIHRMDGGRRPIAARERARVRMAIAECAALVARGHMPAPSDTGESADPAFSPSRALSPRPRAVLERMLLGQNPKAIAQALGIGVYTVREYQSKIYRHFNVSGRDELMAKFVRL